jgi:REP-associated tyrosine transposase
MAWRTSSHAKYDCKYHLIWCPKRRRALRDPEVRAYVAKTFRAIAEECGFWLDTLAVEDDHVHVFLECPPKYSIARVVGILKSISASRTFARFGSLRRKFWSGELWEDFSVTTGSVSVGEHTRLATKVTTTDSALSDGSDNRCPCHPGLSRHKTGTRAEKCWSTQRVIQIHVLLHLRHRDDVYQDHKNAIIGESS